MTFDRRFYAKRVLDFASSETRREKLIKQIKLDVTTHFEAKAVASAAHIWHQKELKDKKKRHKITTSRFNQNKHQFRLNEALRQ